MREFCSLYVGVREFCSICWGEGILLSLLGGRGGGVWVLLLLFLPLPSPANVHSSLFEVFSLKNSAMKMLIEAVFLGRLSSKSVHGRFPCVVWRRAVEGVQL